MSKTISILIKQFSNNPYAEFSIEIRVKGNLVWYQTCDDYSFTEDVQKPKTEANKNV